MPLFKLLKAAKKNGGDKYTCTEKDYEDWAIYIPQEISRPNDDKIPEKDLIIKIKYSDSGPKTA